MRHSSIDLTMNVYTDPRVLDVAGALDSLPVLPLDGSPLDHQQAKATGTDNYRAQRTVAPMVSPNPGKRCILGATADNWADHRQTTGAQKHPVKQSESQGLSKHARQDSNLQPLVPKTDEPELQGVVTKEVTPTPSSGCTNGCTSLAENPYAEHPNETSGADAKRLESLAVDADLQD
ncbi:MAG: hypothetical protein ACR2NU_06510, partial [Aeoliella sp.]